MNRPFIVAELSGEHMGMKGRARELIEAAHAAGADAIKLQTFTPEQMAPEGKVIEAGPWAGQSLRDLYKLTHTPREWHAELFALARSLGMVGFSSVFHPDDVAFLETLDCPIYKISSFENRDYDLIQCAAATGKPIMISTGMASREDLRCALAAARHPKQGNRWPTLLKCTSAYPAPASDANLRTMVWMGEHLNCEIGLSDHTEGIGVAVAGAALGAHVIEKHLTINRRNGGPDAAFSLEPHEFKQLVQACRQAAAATFIAGAQFGPAASEAPQALLRRKSGGKRGD